MPSNEPKLYTYALFGLSADKSLHGLACLIAAGCIGHGKRYLRNQEYG